MIPASTYRLQITADVDLDAAAALVPYLRDLGVGWIYLSPILQSADGSEHGYDVVDPTRVDAARGGAEALQRLSDAAHAAGMGVLVDIVPNHLGVGVAAQNPWWWDVLRRGQDSAHAAVFDIDWVAGSGRVVLPVLGAELDDVLAAGELWVHPEGVARYGDQELPLADGTVPSAPTNDADAVRAVLERQHWAPIFWRRGDVELNYRRFFTITSLAGVRVEDAAVFDATHSEVMRWLRDGLVDGLRIDHIDGLADPRGYLERLARVAATAPYVVIEKILEPGERLPADWAALVAGTTGYDALAEIDRVLTDPAGQRVLDALDANLRAESGLPLARYDDLVRTAKRDIALGSLRAEVNRVVRVLAASGLGDARTEDAVVELLAAFPVYRAYLPDGDADLQRAVDDVAVRRPALVDVVRELAERMRAAPQGELARRFMQTSGPVMAKSVEDRTFYRYTRLTSLTEVGGDPAEFALDAEAFHRAFARRQDQWPHAMTTLTTHDTKRSEDVRARLTALSESPQEWADLLGRLREITSTGDGPFDNLLWQAIIGVWPASPERLVAYANKVARESSEHTSWIDPDADFERRVEQIALAAHGPAAAAVDAFVARIAAPGHSNALSAKLLQLAGPGVPDVYQGTELVDLSLVDPDNRRPVDFVRRRRLLADLDAGGEGWRDGDGAKLLVTSRALRLRRERPELFAGYAPLAAEGSASGHVVAFDRGGAIAVATRLPVGLDARGGWGETTLSLPPGRWREVFTGRVFAGGPVRLATLLEALPVALLARDVR
ncbi:MAG: malto-oligosyltrehalose synthase [Microbacterium sp.]